METSAARSARYDAAMKSTALRRSLVPALILSAVALPGGAAAEEWDVTDAGPDARTIAFEATEGTWMSVDVHPDGRTLAFDLLGDVYTLPVEGGDATLVLGGPAYEQQPRWSPDGSRLLFVSDRGGGENLWTCAPDGSEAEQVTDEDFRLVLTGAWAPDGEFVVGKKHFTSRRSLGAGEFWLYPVRTASGKPAKGLRLTERKNDQQDAGEPELSPDGRTLYWSEDMSGGSTFEYNKDPNGVIYVIRSLDLVTGEQRDVIRRPGGAIRPRVSPDGRYLAYVRRHRDRSILAVHDLVEGGSRDLWDGLSLDQQETWAVFGPYPGYDWMPDGESLVVWAQGGLHRVALEDGGVTRIPFRAQVEQTLRPLRRTRQSVAGEAVDVRVVRWPQLTPDRRTAVFQALGHIHLRDLDDGDTRRLTGHDGHLEFAPRLTRAGDEVVFTTWDDVTGGTVRIASLDGSRERVLVRRPGHYTSADLSPDGALLVYRRGGGDTYRGRRFGDDTGLFLMDLASGKPRRLTRSGRRPRFSPDGERVLFQGREGDRAALISIDLHGGDRRVVATSKYARDFEVSPSGRWLAFEELWQTHLVRLPTTPVPLELSAGDGAFPVRRLSDVSGTYLSFTADDHVCWGLGPELFHVSAALAYADEREPDDDVAVPERRRGVTAERVGLGWSEPVPVPETDLYLVGGRIAPMDDLSVVEDGVVHVRGRRIVAVGTRGEIEVPEGARVLDVSGHTVMPGLVDVHSHTGSSSDRIHSERNWSFEAMLAFGVTTSHDPSNDTQMIHAESELVATGRRVGPRLLSTGTILYGADGDFKAVIDSYEDALRAVRRTKAWGAKSLKSYNQPRRDQRQMVLRAAASEELLVMPEGGSTYVYNIGHILDGHTTLEHALPVAPLYEPDLRLLAESGTCYTPTLVVGYGGLWGENYWYTESRIWEHERLLSFVPASIVDRNARRRTVATDPSEYHHLRLARSAADVVRRGGNVEIGAHGQLQGLGSHWETWMLAQGGLTAHEALRAATWMGARAICLEHELGAVRPGYLADLIVVAGDPLSNVRDSERVQWVMVDGVLRDAATLTRHDQDGSRTALPPGPALDDVRVSELANCACGRGR